MLRSHFVSSLLLYMQLSVLSRIAGNLCEGIRNPAEGPSGIGHGRQTDPANSTECIGEFNRRAARLGDVLWAACAILMNQIVEKRLALVFGHSIPVESALGTEGRHLRFCILHPFRAPRTGPSSANSAAR
jgi:hypothetical protein